MSFWYIILTIYLVSLVGCLIFTHFFGVETDVDLTKEMESLFESLVSIIPILNTWFLITCLIQTIKQLINGEGLKK